MRGYGWVARARARPGAVTAPLPISGTVGAELPAIRPAEGRPARGSTSARDDVARRRQRPRAVIESRAAGSPRQEVDMIQGVHALIYSTRAAEVRDFLRDVVGLGTVDPGPDWPIFALPPAELGVHPSDGPARV